MQPAFIQLIKLIILFIIIIITCITKIKSIINDPFLLFSLWSWEKKQFLWLPNLTNDRSYKFIFFQDKLEEKKILQMLAKNFLEITKMLYYIFVCYILANIFYSDFINYKFLFFLLFFFLFRLKSNQTFFIIFILFNNNLNFIENKEHLFQRIALFINSLTLCDKRLKILSFVQFYHRA